MGNFILVGHSFGTMISMKYCSEHQDQVLAMIIIGGSKIKFLHRIGYPIAKILAFLAYTKSSNLRLVKMLVNLKSDGRIHPSKQL